MRLDKQSLQFAMHDTGLIGDVLEAYERLILDAMRGDHTLFTTAEGIERLWEISEPLAGRALAGASVQSGLMGTERHPSTGRAACVATAVRACLAGPESPGSLNYAPRAQPGWILPDDDATIGRHVHAVAGLHAEGLVESGLIDQRADHADE